MSFQTANTPWKMKMHVHLQQIDRFFSYFCGIKVWTADYCPGKKIRVGSEYPETDFGFGIFET